VVLEFRGGGGEKQVPRARNKALGMTRVLLWFSNSVAVVGKSRFFGFAQGRLSRHKQGARNDNGSAVGWANGVEQDFALDWGRGVL
jgi:hypothetical protein